MILIISHTGDAHAVAVGQALQARGWTPVLLDLSRFPDPMSLELRYGGARSGEVLMRDSSWGDVDLAECRATWWRRPQPFRPPADVADPVLRAFAMNEAREMFGGLWSLIGGAWINDPQRDDLAHRKSWQLRAAAAAGLTTPETLITNSPRAARAFIAGRAPGRTVFKAFSGTPSAWRETRLVGPAEIERLDLVQVAPVIFQEYVAGVDIRVTVIGDRLFSAEIDIGDGDYPVDFRVNYDHIRIRETSLPAEIEAGVRALMRNLGLVYGAIDFRRTPEGRHIFLEINPAGQWMFIEAQTRQPLTEAMADELIALHG